MRENSNTSSFDGDRREAEKQINLRAEFNPLKRIKKQHYLQIARFNSWRLKCPMQSLIFPICDFYSINCLEINNSREMNSCFFFLFMVILHTFFTQNDTENKEG